MSSIIHGFEYDIFISYRQKDNKYDGWVTEFVSNLKKELEATFKEDVSIYFDENPHDGLLETHNVNRSLEGKLKSLIIIPIISQTYCDPKSFAWQNEFCAFNLQVAGDHFGKNVRLANGNIAGRILPVRIHDLEPEDVALFEKETAEVMRPVDFIYRLPGVNRQLRAKDDEQIKNPNQILYRDQINKVARAIKDIIGGLKNFQEPVAAAINSKPVIEQTSSPLEPIRLEADVCLLAKRDISPKRRSRRKFITTMAKSSALAFLPLHSQLLFGETPLNADTIIEAVDFIRVSGPFTGIPGVNRQPQIRPNDIYPELRTPAPYSDRTDAKETTSNITHIYIRIKTKGGLEGLYGALEPEIIAPVLEQLRPFLIGKDALAVETLWDQMYRSNRHARAGHYMMAISAVDNALWDIRGKYFKAPIYELLGGPTRKDVRVYGSCLSFSVEKGKAGPRAKQLLNDGFIHQKWFMAYGPGDGKKGLNKSIELVEELRGAVGEDVQLMFDAFMAWDISFATEWCQAVEKYRPYWIEEAFPPDHLESFVQLRQKTTIPIATGEHFYSRWEVQNYLKAGAIQIVQADPEWCGGVSELVKICSLSSTYGAKVFPHGHNIHAALHVVASQSPELCPLVEYLINHMPNKVHFQKDPLLTTNGIIQLPKKHGFGIEFDESKILKKEIVGG